MLVKTDLSEEELGLYNPAFIGFLLLTCLREFVVAKPGGMHCALSFLVLEPSIVDQTPTSSNLTPVYSPAAIAQKKLPNTFSSAPLRSTQ